MATIKLNYETMVTLLDEKIKPINDRLDAIEKKLNKVSVVDNTAKTVKATKTTTTTSKKSAKTTEKKEEPTSVQRMYIHALKRLEGESFTKTYALVKKYNGRIKNSGRKTKDGKKLACWSFSITDGKMFATEIVKVNNELPDKEKIFKGDVKKVFQSEIVNF